MTEPRIKMFADPDQALSQFRRMGHTALEEILEPGELARCKVCDAALYRLANGQFTGLAVDVCSGQFRPTPKLVQPSPADNLCGFQWSGLRDGEAVKDFSCIQPKGHIEEGYAGCHADGRGASFLVSGDWHYDPFDPYDDGK